MSPAEEIIIQARESFDKEDYDTAKTLCREGIKQLEKSDDNASIKATIKLLNILADSDSMQSRWFDSIISLERIVRLADEQRDLISKAESTIKIGDLFARSGKWDKARSKYLEAETIVKNFSNPYHLGLAEAGLGLVYWRKGDNMEAIAKGKKALEIGENIERDDLIGKAAGLLSSTWNDMGDYDKSLEVNEKAIGAFQRSGNAFDLSRVLNNHGEIHKILGEYDKAIEMFDQGIEVTGSDGNKRILGYLYFNLAECHARLKNIKIAREMAYMADKNAGNLEDKYLKAYIYMSMGMVEDLDGNGEKAIDLHEKAEAIMTGLGIPYDSGVIVLELAISLIKNARKDEGVFKLKQALKLFENAKSKKLIEITQDLIDANS